MVKWHPVASPSTPKTFHSRGGAQRQAAAAAAHNEVFDASGDDHIPAAACNIEGRQTAAERHRPAAVSDGNGGDAGSRRRVKGDIAVQGGKDETSDSARRHGKRLESIRAQHGARGVHALERDVGSLAIEVNAVGEFFPVNAGNRPRRQSRPDDSGEDVPALR